MIISGSDLFVSGVIVRDTTADGINLHTGWNGVTVDSCSFRNTGDDAIALWSDHTADTNVTISHNLVQLPNLANGIAFYGGHDNRAVDNVVADIIASGGGIHVGNRFHAVALAGTTTILRNTLSRCGCVDMNWKFGVGALWFYGLDSAVDPQGGDGIIIQDLNIVDSPQNAIGMIGKGVNNVHLRNIAINGTKTFVLQVQSTASNWSFNNVTATNVGYANVYDCEEDMEAFTMDAATQSSWFPICTATADCKPSGENGTTASTCEGGEKKGSERVQVCAHCGFPPTGRSPAVVFV